MINSICEKELIKFEKERQLMRTTLISIPVFKGKMKFILGGNYG